MGKVWLIVGALAVPACLKDPVPAAATGETNGGDPGPTLQTSMDGDSVFVRLVHPTLGPDTFEIAFDRSGFPRQIGWNGGAQSVETDGSDCTREDGIGLALYPNRLFTETLDEDGLVRTLDSTFAQTLVVRINAPLADAAGSACEGSLVGESIFTIFPDGRIHRHDDVTLAAAEVDGGCGVCGGGPYIFTTYTVARAQLMGGIEPAGIALGDIQSDERIICTRNDGRSLAMGFAEGVGTNQRFRRLTSPTLGAPSVAIVHDIARGSSQQVSNSFVRDSVMLLGATDDLCVGLNARIERLTGGNQVLELRELGQRLTLRNDGIYEYDESSAIAVDEVTLEPVDESIDGGFAVQLSFGEKSTDNLRIRHSNPGRTSVGWARLDRLDGDNLLFFFRDPLVMGESITIRLR